MTTGALHEDRETTVAALSRFALGYPAACVSFTIVHTLVALGLDSVTNGSIDSVFFVVVVFGLVGVFLVSGLLGLPACLLADFALHKGVGYGWIVFAGGVYGAAIGLLLDAAFLGVFSGEAESLPAFTIQLRHRDGVGRASLRGDRRAARGVGRLIVVAARPTGARNSNICIERAVGERTGRVASLAARA